MVMFPYAVTGVCVCVYTPCMWRPSIDWELLLSWLVRPDIRHLCLLRHLWPGYLNCFRETSFCVYEKITTRDKENTDWEEFHGRLRFHCGFTFHLAWHRCSCYSVPLPCVCTVRFRQSSWHTGTILCSRDLEKSIFVASCFELTDIISLLTSFPAITL